MASMDVYPFKTAKPNNPAATLSDGMTPVVRLSLQTMKLKTMLRIKLVAIALTVICFVHGGTGLLLNASSTKTLSLVFCA